MDPDLRQALVDRDETELERAFFDNECKHFFAVDWREDDVDIVDDCATALDLANLTGQWRDDDLVITFEGKETLVPLVKDVADRHITICALNDILSPTYEIRFIVYSHGSDTLGFAALSVADWKSLEKECPATVAENFIDPRKLPNVFTELVDKNLPKAALARFERMLARNRRK